jgi:hypothetical protein
MEYSDLIKAGIVKNEKGECYAPYNGEQSITHCVGVKSERGLYRVWISNLQKMIRRGKLNEAITSMIECVESGDVFKTNVVNRLAKVIVSEDIGLAYPTLPLYCSKIVKKYDEGKLTNEDLIHLVNVLVKSKKSRLIDNLYLHCEKGLTYSFDDSFKLFKEAINDKDVIKAVSYLNCCIDTSIGIKKTINLNGIKKRQQIYEVWEYILNKSGVVYRVNYALLELYISQEKNSGKKLNIIKYMLNIIFKWEIDFDSCLDLCNEEFKGEWKRDIEVWPWSISYDKHSILNAYKLGRGDKFFFEHGAYLENKSDNEWLKIMEEKFKVN